MSKKSIKTILLVEDHGDGMTAIRVLHVNGQPDIRDVVDVSLGLERIWVRACASCADALATAAFEGFVKSVNDFRLAKFKLPQQAQTNE
jgi:hypothetical protein